MKSVKELEQEIKFLEEELRLAKNLEKDVENSSFDKKLAILLRKPGVNEDGWDYEFNNGCHDWNGYAHRYWLKEANKVIDFFKTNKFRIE